MVKAFKLHSVFEVQPEKNRVVGTEIRRYCLGQWRFQPWSSYLIVLYLIALNGELVRVVIARSH